MNIEDDDLRQFEAQGAPPLPEPQVQGHVARDGARIWYASFGAGPAVLLLHGGLGNSGNWGYQVEPLVTAGFRVAVMDTRGHGRSTRDARPFTYDLLASDTLAVMDALQIEHAAVIGWSDGACTGLILAHHHPERVDGILFFACNMDPDGTKEFVPTPVIDRCFSRHGKDYAAFSAAPDQFSAFVDAVGKMQRTEPNYTTNDLAEISVPVTILHAEHDEFIKHEHAQYLAQNIPGAEFVHLAGVSHFAPLQRPQLFNDTILALLRKPVA